MTVVNRATAAAAAEVVRTEAATAANTASRIGQLFRNLVDSAPHFTGDSNSPIAGRQLQASSSTVSAWVERNLTRVTSVPTTGYWQAGDILLWSGVERLALRATLTGALTITARGNSTTYSESGRLSSGTRIFVVAVGGTTAGSAPAGLATASYGDRVIDGSAVLECIGTTVQGPSFESIPRLDGAAVALANSSITVNIGDGPIRECATATANRTTTLGTTGAVTGDVLTFRRIANSPGAFTWLFDGTSGGGDSILIPASTRAVVSFVFNGTVWVARGCTGTLS